MSNFYKISCLEAIQCNIDPRVLIRFSYSRVH